MASSVLIVGGVGRIEADYRREVHRTGRDLVYCERGTPGRMRSLALVIICTGCCSHPQREAAELVAQEAQAPVVHLRSPSISALRRALAQLPPPAPEAQP